MGRAPAAPRNAQTRGETPEPTGQVDADPATFPLERFDPSDGELFAANQHHGWFARLRREAPVHYTPESHFGAYWSVTRFDDIVVVEKDAETYSSARAITVSDPVPDTPMDSSFITMDGPTQLAHRKTVAPALGPRNLKRLEPIVRERVAQILDELPIGEEFDWVDRVSVELTTSLLATLFDFPFEERRRKLTFWSDTVNTLGPNLSGPRIGQPGTRRRAELRNCLACSSRSSSNSGRIRGQRRLRPPEPCWRRTAQATREHGSDGATSATLMLLIVGGNDTTRNSISAVVSLPLNQFPGEYEKLRRPTRSLIPNMVSRDHPLADAARPHAPHRHVRHRARRPIDPGRGQGPSCGTSRAIATRKRSTARTSS